MKPAERPFTTDASGRPLHTRLKLAKAGRSRGAATEDSSSKEPLGPFVRTGDDQWFDIVKWVHFAMLQCRGAKRQSKKNLEEQMKSENPRNF